MTRYTFICIPGAKYLDGLDEVLSCLKENGIVEAVEAFNINKLTDKQAGETAAKLREKLSAFGFKVTSAVWGDKSQNSVDDYYLHRIKKSKNHVHIVNLQKGEDYEYKMLA